MPIKKIVSEENKSVSISIENRFDFSLHQKFRDAYVDVEIPLATYYLDLAKTTYMDSSALGMILLLKDHAENHGGTVVIKNPTAAVYKILEIAQFHRLMTIENS